MLHGQHAGALKRYALGSGADEGRADDLVQDAFLKYFLTRLAGQPVNHPQAWLFTVVRNGWLEHLRSAQNRRETVLESAAHVGAEAEDSTWVSLWALALNLLAPRERECLQLRRDGLQYDEIAQALGIRAGTVAALLARAQMKIRQGLAGVTA